MAHAELEKWLPRVLAAHAVQYATSVSRNPLDVAWRGEFDQCTRFVEQRDIDRALVGASIGGHARIAQMMLQAGARVLDGALKAACLAGEETLAFMMIAHGATNWGEAMLIACQCRLLRLVHFFMRKKACLREGFSGACIGGHRDLVDLTIAAGANEWNLGLCCAAQAGHAEIAKLMIARGASNFPLAVQIAMNNNRWEMVLVLADAIRG